MTAWASEILKSGNAGPLKSAADYPDRFEVCIGFVLEHECSCHHGRPVVEHDPNDPGGTTFCGIDQRDHPNVNVSGLTIGAVKEIYRAIEWTKARCEQFKVPWDLAVLDTAVNPGLGFVGKALQKAVGGVVVDGFIGPKTIAAVNASPLSALDRFLDLRVAYYEGLPAHLKDEYLNGWLARVTDLRSACGLEMLKSGNAGMPKLS